jgi:hypothetical protein
MSPSQREKVIMIESSFSASCGMTGIAGWTVISIAAYTIVSIIRFGFIIMRVAVDTGVYTIVCRIRMAI